MQAHHDVARRLSTYLTLLQYLDASIVLRPEQNILLHRRRQALVKGRIALISRTSLLPILRSIAFEVCGIKVESAPQFAQVYRCLCQKESNTPNGPSQLRLDQ